MTFLSPTLAWLGLGAAAIPIIIHLMNRRRFRRVDWAPMKYLRLTIQSNRRRLRLEQLLLLVLRVLLMLVLFLTMARPMLSSDSLAAWLASGSRRTRVIVIDDSLSMSRTRDDGSSSFDRAKSTCVEIVRSVNPADQLTLFAASRPDAPLARNTQVDDPAELITRILALVARDGMNQWIKTFDAIDDLLAGGTYRPREIILITDLQDAGWTDDIASLVRSWVKDQTRVTIVDVSDRPTSSLAASRLDQVTPFALIGTPIALIAEVTNHSEQPADPQSTQLFVDGQPRSVDVPAIEARSTVAVPIRIEVSEPGPYRIHWELPNDSLPADNRRYAVVQVAESLSVVMVDGDPRPGSFRGETDFLAAACQAGRAPWQVAVVSEIRDILDLAAIPDVIVLANVGLPTPDMVAQLERLVRQGSGLVIFAGELVDARTYNELLFKDGHGPLPAAIREVLEGDITGLTIEPLERSPLDLLHRFSPEVLARIRPKRFLDTEIQPSDQPAHTNEQAVRVIARWNHPDRPAACIEKRFGAGRVYLWTTTADRDWSDWPQEPSYVLAMRQTVLFAATRDISASTIVAGEPMRVDLPISQRVTETFIQTPASDERSALPVTRSETAAYLEYADTYRSGLYRLGWSVVGGSPAVSDFAVNVDPRESNPSQISAERLNRILGDANWRIVKANGATDRLTHSTELWRWSAAILLGLIGCESLLVAWIGRER